MKIERGIPVPEHLTATIWPFPQMEVGDSIALDRQGAERARNAASSYQKSHPGVKFAVRKTGDEEWRLWRTA
jgi:hypothetical protein